jgi:beta-lactamase regulating signal transducer with metallopeptidase domain
MAGLTFLQEAARFALPFIPMLFEAFLRVTLFLGVAFCALWIMKSASPARRHALWLAAICGSLFLFLLTVTGPVFRVAFRHGVQETPGALPALSSLLLPATGTLKTPGGMAPLAAQAWRRITLVQGWLSFWPSGVLLVWIAGVLWGWFRVLWGRLQLLSLARGARNGEERRVVRALAARIGIRHEVRVVTSGGCVTPMTRGIFHSIIFLPSSMRRWSAAARKSVLLHELRHIRRADSFTLAAAYGICSLLWFIPPIWAAYSRLYLEQEKACDAAVVGSGMNPHAYATCILDTAQLCREPALLAGLSLSGRRKQILKDRIGAIIRLGKPAKKSVLPFCLAAALLGLSLLLGAAGNDAGRKYGSVYLTEYNVRSADEAGILNTLIQFQEAYNSHSLGRLSAFFAKGASYMPCGYARLPIESPSCQAAIQRGFQIYPLQIYYDPAIVVHGRTAVVNVLLEAGYYLRDYTFLMEKAERGWLVQEAFYGSHRLKG